MNAKARVGGTALIRNVLVISPNWIGDTIMALPMVAGLRTALPDAHIVVVATPSVAPLWQTTPHVNQIWSLDTSGGTGWANHIHMVARIKRGHFDAAVILPHDVGFAVTTFLAGVPVRVGEAVGGRGVLLTHTPAGQPGLRRQHMIENRLDLLRLIGLDPGVPELVLAIDQSAQAKADAILAANGVGESDFLIGLAPGAAFGRAKRWPKERFAALADRLVEDHAAKVLLMLGPQDMDLGIAIRSLVRHEPLFWESTFPLLQSAALIKRCRVFVSNDSGPMHMAAAVGTRVVAVFGSSSPVWTGPPGRAHVVLRKPLACSPCFQRQCELKTYECLESITVEDVLAAVEVTRRSQWEAAEEPRTAIPR